MIVNEIFRSIQGESSYAGLPCVFIRLTGCNLRCQYCDTRYAYEEGKHLTLETVYNIIANLYNEGDIIEFTGGEPLMQYKDLNKLIRLLRMTKYSKTPILIETNGSYPINLLTNNKHTHIIMDWKCPSSEMNSKMQFSNLNLLEEKDELKFVLSDFVDFGYMETLLRNNNLKCQILISTVWGIDRKEFVEEMLRIKLKARFQIQLHKLIWDINKRGV